MSAQCSRPGIQMHLIKPATLGVAGGKRGEFTLSGIQGGLTPYPPPSSFYRPETPGCLPARACRQPRPMLSQRQGPQSPLPQPRRRPRSPGVLGMGEVGGVRDKPSPAAHTENMGACPLFLTQKKQHKIGLKFIFFSKRREISFRDSFVRIHHALLPTATAPTTAPKSAAPATGAKAPAPTPADRGPAATDICSEGPIFYLLQQIQHQLRIQEILTR